MSNKTVQYKRTLRGSVGAGVGALFNGNGRRFFILEHKDASKYHKAGESQKIIIDQVELGRDANCQVRFDDETFPTVSRRHAAIVKDGDKWKLIQLSQTNSTFLNGKPVTTEWYLENGDEIQLSAGGPRMGFIVPAGKQSLVSSIKMTERLELFRKQALRPYKRAIACMFILLVVLSCGGGYVIWNQDKSIKDLLAMTETQHLMIQDAKKKYQQDSIEWAEKIKNIKPVTVNQTKVIDGDQVLTKQIDVVKSSVYAVLTTVYQEVNGESQKIARSIGTGFLTSDGTFVTARHCVEPWLFNMELNEVYALCQASQGLYKIYAVVTAVNNENESITIRSDRFVVDNSYDTSMKVKVTVENETFELDSKVAFGSESSLGNDWAYCKVGKSGKIQNGKSMSGSLKSGTTVHVLGFPRGNGIGDGQNIVDPIYNKLSVARNGLTNARCIMVNQGIDHGNSGGPVFMQDKGKLYVIGIVSRGDHNSKFYNHLIPMCNLK